jgi:epsilon-lactone hydrolase
MPSAELQMMVDMIRSHAPAGVPTVDDLRQQADASGGLMPLPDDVEVTPVDAGGVRAEWVRTPGAREGAAVVHFHGGGYAVAGPSRDFPSRLARAAAAPVLVVDYRLAPEHPFPAALDDAEDALDWVVDQGVDPGRLAVLGESSGGGLAAAALVARRDRGVAQPAAGVLLSPWTDMALTGDSITSRAADDPLVTADLLRMLATTYLDGRQPQATPLASPLYADLAGLPPLLVQVGTAEILLDDSVRLAEKARAAGVDVTLDVWDDMIHVWQLFAVMVPEGQQAIDQIGAFILKHTS